MEMNMKMDAGTTFEVVNSAEVKDIKMTYTKMHMSMDMGQLKKLNASDSIMNAAYSNIVGKSVVLKLSPNNEIVGVTGFDEIMNEQRADSASKEMMKNMFSKDQLNSMFGMMFSMYPKKPVKVGESWNAETIFKMANLDMKVDYKYKLLSVRNGLAEISQDGTIGAAGDMVKGSGIKMDMSGTQKGTITIKMDKGYLHSASYKMDIKADMQAMGQKIPMTMKADYTLKGN